MTKTQMMLIGAGLFIAMKWAQRRQVENVITATQDWRDGSNWYEDSWARLHGRDLSLDGNHPAPGGFDPYGITNVMGWSYGWDGTLSKPQGTLA